MLNLYGLKIYTLIYFQILRFQISHIAGLKELSISRLLYSEPPKLRGLITLYRVLVKQTRYYIVDLGLEVYFVCYLVLATVDMKRVRALLPYL